MLTMADLKEHTMTTRPISIRSSQYSRDSDFDIIIKHNDHHSSVVTLTMNELYNLRELLMDMPLLPEIPAPHAHPAFDPDNCPICGTAAKLDEHII